MTFAQVLLHLLVSAIVCGGSPVDTKQRLTCYATWGASAIESDGQIYFRALGRDAAGQQMHADTGASAEKGQFLIGSGSWDRGTGMLRVDLIESDGTRSAGAEDSVDALAQDHLFTYIGAAASEHGNPEPKQFLSGDIAELIVFNRLLAPEERSEMEAHLYGKHVAKEPSNESLPITQGLILQLDAARFNPTAAVWSDSSGHGSDATSFGSGMTIAPAATPAGGPAVRFGGRGGFKICARPGLFDGQAHTWYVVFRSDRARHAPLLSNAYGNIARPLDDPEKRLPRMSYNHPGLIVDLGVGLWANPLPMDADRDGRPDLYVVSTGKTSGGIYHFRPLNDGHGPTRFHPGQKVAWATHNLRASRLHDGRWVVLGPGRRYDGFTEHGLSRWTPIDYEPSFHISRANQWGLFDYDGDGVDDLIIGTDDWREYGWDDAFDKKGKWTNGLLRGSVWWVPNRGTNDEPVYGDAQTVMAGDKPVETYGNPCPNFADFNGDQLPDLICGEFLDRLLFFENVGTRTEPRFAPGRYLETDGQVLTMAGQMIVPSAIDWDGDGHVDLVIGEEDGTVSLLRHSGRTDAGMPVFERPEKLQQSARQIMIGSLCTPSAIDWDADGDTDMLLGDSAGYVNYLENLGGAPPRWAAPVRLEAEGQTIRILAGSNGSIQGPAEAKWGYTVVEAADWDHDGLPDLLTNDIWGKVHWYKNVGTKSAPRLAAAQPLAIHWQGIARFPPWNWWTPKGDAFVTQWRSSIQAIDLTGDGLLDLVALDEDGYLALFERQRLADGGTVLAPGKRVFHVEPGAASAFDNQHRPMTFDQNGDGINDLTVLDERGQLPFYYRKIAFVGRTAGLPARSADRRNDPRYQDNDSVTALRLTAGWAGRSGRRKFVLVDWDRDGRLDLLVNSISVNFLKNVSQEPGRFVFCDMGPVTRAVLAGHTTCPEVTDLDGDDALDLIIGAEDGYLYHMAYPDKGD